MSRAPKRDKELAIDMWHKILGYVCREESCNLNDLKEKFCCDNNVHWLYDCLLCDIHCHRCCNCELGTCNGDNDDFFIVFDYLESPNVCNKKSAITACENIIEVLNSLEEESSEEN